MIISIIILMILIYINGVFSSCELAFLSLNKIKLKEDVDKGDTKAIAINRIIEQPSLFLSTIQIGITLAGFLASAFASEYFANYFITFFVGSKISIRFIKTILVIVITIVLSYFTLIFGELVPKRVAINDPYRLAKTYIYFIKAIQIMFYPLIIFLSFSTEIICKTFRIRENKDRITEEDIKTMILLGQEEGIIEEKEKEYILNVFNFKDIEVQQVMTPRDKVIMINVADDLKSIISKIKEEKFSRFPVYKDNENNIIGTISIKDLIIKKGEKNRINIRKIVRPTHRFNHTDKIDDVFREMQERNESICPIYNNGRFVGIVTIEDAVEEIVGNIYDEFDDRK